MVKCELVPLWHIDSAFEQVCEGLQTSCNRSGGDLDAAYLHRECRSAASMLVVASNDTDIIGAVVLRFENWSGKSVLRTLALWCNGKDKKKPAEPAAPTVATNPNYIAMQQPQPFAPGMKEALASQLSQGYSSPGLLGSSAPDFTGLLNTIYSPQAIAADPIGVAQSVAAATSKPAAAPSIKPKQNNSYNRERMRDKR